ncbi:IS21 family transposase [Cryobacterium sp. GrIS_2_6]|uniref:IS21 family transposase n=1 Tax=Cryobacterium sp. GrIS_2_6 TaxID=3162785 RepID=UPI002E0C89B7|nr:IS21 family transposase [Cryobacterium psychrotolerans]MEC5149902.1 transposase [Cryobacterium psychrotolerans]MEC5150288.1 transposase [Cryobacterium psychrotolerans]
MKFDGEIMEILAAYDLTESLRAAAELTGCSHHTVARHVAARDAGRPLAEPAYRGRVTDPFLPKIEEWVEASQGKIRADRAHAKLIGLGYAGSERSTRRAVAQVRAAFRLGRVRVHRPWITEPGMWLQYDFGDGPVIDGKKTVLFVAWLAWSRFRIVIALRDRTAPSVFAALDRSFRLLGGAPTYVLTDNEKTVTVSHVAGVPVRNPQTVDFARHYGVSVLTCQPADPASKGGVESSVKLAKADIVPKDTNLRPDYASFAEVEAACEAFMALVNTREHRATRRKPSVMLEEERPRLHRVPDTAHTVALGLTRAVPENTPMVTFENGQYSVPAHLLGARVFVRSHGVGSDEQVVIVHVGSDGPVEVARHQRARPGSPKIDDAHFPDHREKIPGDYTITPRSAAETEFLAIGAGAHAWLLEAAAAGTARMNVKMAEAVALAKISGTAPVDEALGQAATYGRFATGDLASLLSAGAARPPARTAGETSSLAQGTAGWAAIGQAADDELEQSA